MDIYNIIQYFFIYSFMGWLMETIYVSIRQKRFVNRGFINGPVCSIYGYGAMTVYILLMPYKNNIPVLFVLGIIIPSVIEYFTGLLLEILFNSTWWDYSNAKFNIKGRVCLFNSIIWGFLTILLFYVLQPTVEYICGFCNATIRQYIMYGVIIVYTADTIITVFKTFDFKVRMNKMSDVINQYMDNIKKLGLREKKFKINLKELNIRDIIKNKTINGKEEIVEKIFELKGIYQKLKDENNFVFKRFVNSYPHFKINVKSREEIFMDIKNKMNKKKK